MTYDLEGLAGLGPSARPLSASAPLLVGVPVAGADPLAHGWVAVSVDAEGRAVASAYRSFEGVLALDAEVIAVDVPLGTGEGWRAADSAARRFVGPRFGAPSPAAPRSVVHRMREVEPFAVTDGRIIEVHPEVSFTELAGRHLDAKKRRRGAAERRALLEAAGLELPELPAGVPELDLLDAAVAAWSAARYAHGEARPLPAWHAQRIGAIWR